ncbi:MAG: DHH family phosphoesterase, partial [Deinococcales bacterium]
MRLIVTHEQPDFDALASLALARLLFPNAVATIQGSLSPGLTAFLRLYRDQLELAEPQTIDLGTVTDLVVVDTADAGRIHPFDRLVSVVPVTLYDHHPPPAQPIPAARGLREQVGATATVLTRELMATGIAIPPPIASLA